jgi:hypothetical protein
MASRHQMAMEGRAESVSKERVLGPERFVPHTRILCLASTGLPVQCRHASGRHRLAVELATLARERKAQGGAGRLL